MMSNDAKVYDEDQDEIRLSQAVTTAVQLRTLRTVLMLVKRAAELGDKPVVEVDLDLTAVMPIYRTCAALVAAGRVAGIKEFLHPINLSILPGYSDEAWMSFVRTLDLEAAYPEIRWSDSRGGPNKDPAGPFAEFHGAFWNSELILDDVPTPGLGSFVHRVGEAGGEVVFISGRWLKAQIDPTFVCLRRAGISDPRLVIGNDRHSTLVPSKDALSDADAKVLHQVEIMKHGRPVAIIDDRVTNRRAVIDHLGKEVLGIAVCIPGFTHDPASNDESLRISTFETFDNVLADCPIRPYMLARYGRLGIGEAWRGLYEGLGLNQRSYVLPRLYSGVPPSGCRRTWSIAQPFVEMTSRNRPGSLDEEEFLELCTHTIPADQLARLKDSLPKAQLLSSRRMAAPFPETKSEHQGLWLTLITSWLHSRDIEQLITFLGYPLRATGLHDIEEFVAAREIKARIRIASEAGALYSDWVLRWLSSIADEEAVNVGCLNPALLVGMWRWTPDTPQQDAMEIHRASSHHAGDGNERYDPIEAAVNNVLHQREGRFGIRKEKTVGWRKMLRSVERDSNAETLARSSVGRQAIRDAIDAAIKLERTGSLTPWGLVAGASFED